MSDLYYTGNPLVSVIMATFNRAAYLQRSISSFISQSYKDAELVVVDDGSEDDTFEIVNKYVQQHHNIRYMKHSNRKLSVTRNVGIKAAAGKLIAFLDSDDEYKPDYLIYRVEYMRANANVDMIQGGAIIIGDPFVKDKNDPTVKIHLSECCIGATFFGKSEVFSTLDGFDKNILYGEDSDFLERAEKVFTIRKIDHEGYVYYRDTPDGICNTV